MIPFPLNTTRRSQGLAAREISLRGRNEDGFTLVELLVAACILALMVVLMAQMIGSVALSTAASSKRLGADDETRTVFDRMAGDFSCMIMRPDVNPLWVTGSGNDEFYFYSQAPSSFTNSTNSQIGLIGYRVTTNGLERLGKGLGWDSLYFTNGSVSTNTVAATNYNIIAPSVFRLEYTLLMKPGSTNNNGTINGAGVYSQTNNTGQAMKDVSGIVVTLGVLDQTSRKITSTNTINGWTNDTTDFPDATTTNTPAASWLSKIQSLTGIPQAARSQIRIYQRYFPLNR